MSQTEQNHFGKHHFNLKYRNFNAKRIQKSGQNGQENFQRKVLFENWSKYDNKLDVDEMHIQFSSQFLYKTSGDFNIFCATAMDMFRGKGCQLRRIAQSVNPTTRQMI